METIEQLISIGAGRQFSVSKAHQRKARNRYTQPNDKRATVIRVMNRLLKTNIILFIFVLLFSCYNTENSEQPSNNDTTKTNSSESIKLRKKKPDFFVNFNVNNLAKSDEVFVNFWSKNDDGSVYISPDSNSVSFIFGLNRCEQSFPAIDSNNSIMLKWNMSEKIMCTYKNYFNQSFGLKKHPENGDIFAIILAKNDSILRINYVFKDFIDEQNKRGRINNEFKIDTLFPTLFKCTNCN